MHFHVYKKINNNNNSEQSELYGRESDQGKVTYNDIYFKQESLWSIFFLFSSPKLSPEVGRTGTQKLGLTNKRHKVTRNECQ